jgi:hypothetical protein
MRQVSGRRGEARIVYANHYQPVYLAAVQIPGERPGAIVLETGDTDWSTNPETTLRRYRESDRQYATLLPLLERERIPVYFLEAATSFPARDVALMGAESATGIAILHATIRAIREKRLAHRVRERLWSNTGADGLSRRDWLAAGLTASIAGWLQFPLASSLARGFGHGFEYFDGPTARFRRAAVTTHPECERTHLFRNAILAYKLQILQAMERTGSLVAVLGPTHSPIEDDLRTPRPVLLTKLREFLPSVEVAAPSTVSEVCRLEFLADRWQTVHRGHVPELQALYA